MRSVIKTTKSEMSSKELLEAIPGKTEYDECVDFWNWVKTQSVLVGGFHISNEGKRQLYGRSSGEGLRRIGLTKGTADYFFPYARHGYHGIFLEMKRKDKKAKLTEEQKWFLKIQTGCGYMCWVARGALEAITYLKDYMDLEKDDFDLKYPFNKQHF